MEHQDGLAYFHFSEAERDIIADYYSGGQEDGITAESFVLYNGEWCIPCYLLEGIMIEFEDVHPEIFFDAQVWTASTIPSQFKPS